MGLLPSPSFCPEIKKFEVCDCVCSLTTHSPQQRHLNSFSHLAPGAQVLIKNITDPDRPDSQRVDVRKQVRKLTIDEWSLLIEAFHQWSFAPEVLCVDTTVSDLC